MPTRKLTGMPKSRKGAKFMVIKSHLKGKWHLRRLRPIKRKRK